ncbi:CWC16 protein [Aspergillus unguis]
MQGFSTFNTFPIAKQSKARRANNASSQIWGGMLILPLPTPVYLPNSAHSSIYRYIPPDLEGTTTPNKLAGKHPLGARARHLHTKGALVVRFEMPFATWCTNCVPEEIIGQGVRFNAEKKKVGNYYSTPIYSFRFKHTVCGKWIEIRTDPKNTDYVVTEGGRRRDTGEDKDGEREGEIVLGGVRAGGSAAGADDPFAKIETKVEDKRAVDQSKARILELQKRQARDWDDPYEVSRRLRRGFRAERKTLEKEEGRKEALKDKMSLGIEIVDEREEDGLRAAMVEFDEAGGRGGGNGSSGLRSKPMFETKALTLGTKSGDKKKNGKRKPADLIAERKAMFRSELAGNTRAAVDPFLNGDTASAWEPEVKKRKGSNKAGSEGKKDSERVPGDASRSTSNDPGSPKGASEESKQQNISVSLVDYGSDSE